MRKRHLSCLISAGRSFSTGGVMSGRGPSLPPYPNASGPTQTLMDVVKMEPGLLPPIPPTPEAISVGEILMHQQAFADTAAALKARASARAQILERQTFIVSEYTL